MRYIVFEGVDFTGKTTLINMLYNHVKDSQATILTNEPGSPHSETCVNIRQLLMNSKGMMDLTYALLFSADANEHLNKVVVPALEQGKVVLSDRCMISDFAYRPNIDYDIKRQNFELFESLNPVIYYLSCSEQEIEKRMIERSKDTPILEYEKLKVLNRISELNENYLEFLYKSELDFTIVNTDGETVEQSFNLLLSLI